MIQDYEDVKMIGEIFEAIFEFLLESAIDGSQSSKVPKPVRIILKVIIFVVYGGFILLFAWLAFGFFRNGEIAAGIFMLALTLLFIGLVYFKVLKRKR